MAENPYRAWVERFASLLQDGADIGADIAADIAAAIAAAIAAPITAAIVADPAPRPSTGTRTALIFAPHPDDEVIIGALPLRLQRECGFRVVNMAVTLGSRPDRREARWREAGRACAALGFDLITPDRAGLEGITPAGQLADPERWRRAVAATAALVAQLRPDIVFLPHEADWNQTHIGVHALAVEALRAIPGLRCSVVETEYWGAMSAPNLMIESSASDVADLVAALSLHAGEVARNPFHLRLPSWLLDNVRRGAELVGGQGAASPPFTFATLYRLRPWRHGTLADALPQGILIGQNENPDNLFDSSSE